MADRRVNVNVRRRRSPRHSLFSSLLVTGSPEFRCAITREERATTLLPFPMQHRARLAFSGRFLCCAHVMTLVLLGPFPYPIPPPALGAGAAGVQRCSVFFACARLPADHQPA